MEALGTVAAANMGIIPLCRKTLEIGRINPTLRTYVCSGKIHSWANDVSMDLLGTISRGSIPVSISNWGRTSKSPCLCQIRYFWYLCSDVISSMAGSAVATATSVHCASGTWTLPQIFLPWWPNSPLQPMTSTDLAFPSSSILAGGKRRAEKGHIEQCPVQY